MPIVALLFGLFLALFIIGFLTFIFTIIFLSLAPIVSGILLFHVSQLAFKYYLLKKYFTTGSFVSLINDENKLVFVADKSDLDGLSEISYFNILSIIIGGLSATAVMILMANNGAFVGVSFGEFTSNTPEKLSIVACTIIVSLAYFIYVPFRCKALSYFANQKLMRTVEALNTQLEMPQRYIDYTKEIREVCDALEIPKFEDYYRNIYNNVKLNVTKIIDDKSILDEIISNEVRRMGKDVDGLRKSLIVNEDVMKLYNEALIKANKLRNEAIFILLDEAVKGIKICKAFLEEKNWNAYEANMEMIHNELEDLLINIQHFHKTSSDGHKSNSDKNIKEDPYSILGVKNTLSKDEIKFVYRQLCHIYHPDKGYSPDDEKFKEINEAYNHIINK